MAVGFGHDAEIQIQHCEISSTIKHHLYIGSIEQSLQALCLFGLDIIGVYQIDQAGDVSSEFSIKLINLHAKFVQSFAKSRITDHAQ